MPAHNLLLLKTPLNFFFTCTKLARTSFQQSKSVSMVEWSGALEHFSLLALKQELGDS